MADNNIVIRDPSSASKKEVVLVVKSLIAAFKKANQDIKVEVKTIKADNTSSLKSLETDFREALSDLKVLLDDAIEKTQDKAYKALNAECYKLEKMIAEIPQFSPAQLEEKFATVISNLESELASRIDASSNKQTPVEVRDGLETLSGDERLSWNAVNGVVGIHVGKMPPEDKEMLWVDVR